MPDPTNIPNNLEVDKALKEFEAKNAEQAQKAPETSKTPEISQKEVEGVKFETDSYKAVKYYNETETPKIIKWVMKFSGGAIKEEKQAEYVLLGFVIVAIAISLFLFIGVGHTSQKPTNKMIEEMKQLIPNSIK